MKIARITGSVTATVKESGLSGIALLVADIEDGKGTVLERALVVADTCSAGPGDLVLVATGSAARLSARTSGVPVDAAVVAIIDHIDLAGGEGRPSSPSRRKS